MNIVMILTHHKKTSLSRLLISLHFLLHLMSTAGNESWLWERDDFMVDTQMASYLLESGTFANQALCALTCLRLPDCLTFFVTNTNNPEVLECRFHARLYTQWEKDTFGVAVPGSTYFRIHTPCPISENHFLSREARMCVAMEAENRRKVDAESVCVGQGGHLAILDDQVKVDFVASILLGSWRFTNHQYHVGASYSYNSSLFQWDNGQTVSFSLLANHNPGFVGWMCMSAALTGSNVLSATVNDCFDTIYSICEIPI